MRMIKDLLREMKFHPQNGFLETDTTLKIKRVFPSTFSRTRLECLEKTLIVATCVRKIFGRNIGKPYKRLLITSRCDQGDKLI